MFKLRKGNCSICGKVIGKSVSSNKCPNCYKDRRKLQDQYRQEYWEGVKNGTIRRGVKFKQIVTSGYGEPLTYAVIYEDNPLYETAQFIIPKKP